MLPTQRWSEQGLALLQLLLVASFSKSEERVCSLMGEPEEPQLFKTGDIILGGIFSFHSTFKTVESTYVHRPLPLQCISLNFRAIQYAQVMLFAIEEINNSTDILPGIKLGYKLYDLCGSIARAVKKPCSGSVPAIVGVTSSSPCMAISTVIGPFHTPLVKSYKVTSFLNIQNLYIFLYADSSVFFQFLSPYLDYYQSRALAQMVKHFGWTWVGAIRSNDDYGNNGMAIFIDTATELGICLEYSLPFIRTDPPEQKQKIIETIKGSTSKVIIAFVNHMDMDVLIEEFAHHNLTGYQWVGTESWISDSQNAQAKGHYILDGSIGLAIRKAHVTGLREFILDDLTQIKNSFHDMSLMPIFNNVYKAVYAVAHTLHTIIGCGDTCSNTIASDPQVILQHLKKIRFKTKDGEEVYFNQYGDPAAKYDIINWQPKKDGSVEFVTVGLFDASLPEEKQLHIDNLTLTWANNSKQVPISVCSGTCALGTRKVLQKGKPVCCYDCIPCAEGEVNSITCVRCHPEFWSNKRRDECEKKETEFLSYTEIMGTILTLSSLLGACLTATVAFIFFRHRNTPIVKANNSELSFLLLFSLTLCFLCSLTFIGRPSDWSCIFRHTAFGITFVLCISCVLGKTLAVLMAFKATLPGSNLMKWFGPRRQRIVVLAFTFIQVVICIVWVTANPPYPFKNLRHFKDKIILECALGSPIGFWAVLGYIGLLAMLCFILAILARKLPDNFNEAKFITFSMLIFCAVWMTFIPAYVSSPGKFSVAVEIFAILASSFGLLFCIFVPKCYIILLKPERNTKKNMMEKKMCPFYGILKTFKKFSLGA
uniref:G-protein coupled receptors family 3 profile domain-containing protein n=1 Tax=Gadus morhua TaxID=8049 RepID=A0A8C5BW59_GADMO